MTPAESSSGHAGPDRARETGPALHAHYRFILWLVPAVARFPRSQKFLLGDRIQGLDVLEALIEACASAHFWARAWLFANRPDRRKQACPCQTRARSCKTGGDHIRVSRALRLRYATLRTNVT